MISVASPQRRLKVLFLTREATAGKSPGGDFEYSRHLAESLRVAVDVRIVAYADGSRPHSDEILVPRTRHSRFSSLASTLPNVSYRESSESYWSAALAELPGVDAVIVDFLAMFWCVRRLREAAEALPDPPRIIVVNHNHEGRLRLEVARKSGLKMPPLLLDAVKADNLERAANRLADGFIAISALDAHYFREDLERPGLLVPPGFRGRPKFEIRPLSERPPRVTVLGNFEAFHRKLALSAVLASLGDLGDSMTIDVCGAGEFLDLQQQYPKVNFRGFIPTLDAYLNDVRIGIVADNVGGGFKIRTLTYALHRVPMLGLKSAMGGTGFIPDEHFVAVSNLASLRGRLLECFDQLDRLDQIASAALDFANANFGWANRGAEIAAFIHQLAALGHRGPMARKGTEFLT